MKQKFNFIVFKIIWNVFAFLHYRIKAIIKATTLLLFSNVLIGRSILNLKSQETKYILKELIWARPYFWVPRNFIYCYSGLLSFPLSLPIFSIVSLYFSICHNIFLYIVITYSLKTWCLKPHVLVGRTLGRCLDRGCVPLG